MIFDFLDDPVDGDDEVEHKDQEDDHLEQDWVDVEGAGHLDRWGEGGDGGKAFVGDGEEVRESHILFSKIIYFFPSIELLKLFHLTPKKLRKKLQWTKISLSY